jgi:hypothetical protein
MAKLEMAIKYPFANKKKKMTYDMGKMLPLVFSDFLTKVSKRPVHMSFYPNFISIEYG